MGKLQRIDRKDGTSVYHLTLPKDLIEELGWKKGDFLGFGYKNGGNSIEIYKE